MKPFAHLIALDMTPLSSKELSWLLHEKVISLPSLVRNLLALKSSGVEEVLIQYRLEQDIVRKTLNKYPFLNNFITWFPSTKSKPMSQELINNLAEKGGFWLHPSYLVNPHFLRAFEEAIQQNPEVGFAKNAISKQNCYWMSKSFFDDFFAEGSGDFQNYFNSKIAQDLSLNDPKAKGLLVKNLDDVLKAERMLGEVFAIQKPGNLEKIALAPLRFWLAKHLASSHLPPDAFAILATLLGLLASFLVFFAGEQSIYWPYQVGALLFYFGELLWGTEHLISELTAKKIPLSKRYGYRAQKIVLLLFLLVSTRAAYHQSFHHNVALLSILATAAISISAVLYLLLFTAKRFGKASIRLYEKRFLHETAKDHMLIWIYDQARKILTRDIVVLASSATVFFCQPGMVPGAIALTIVLCFAAILYLNKHYAPPIPQTQLQTNA